MTKESNHSQDYDRKHGNDHNVKDKAALKEKFIDNKRKDAGRKDASSNKPANRELSGQNREIQRKNREINQQSRKHHELF